MNLQLHCACGASWAGDLPDHVAEAVKKRWEADHQPGTADEYGGNNHNPCDAATAARARRKAESEN